MPRGSPGPGGARSPGWGASPGDARGRRPAARRRRLRAAWWPAGPARPPCASGGRPPDPRPDTAGPASLPWEPPRPVRRRGALQALQGRRTHPMRRPPRPSPRFAPRRPARTSMVRCCRPRRTGPASRRSRSSPGAADTSAVSSIAREDGCRAVRATPRRRAARASPAPRSFRSGHTPDSASRHAARRETALDRSGVPRVPARQTVVQPPPAGDRRGAGCGGAAGRADGQRVQPSVPGTRCTLRTSRERRAASALPADRLLARVPPPRRREARTGRASRRGEARGRAAGDRADPL